MRTSSGPKFPSPPLFFDIQYRLCLSLEIKKYGRRYLK
jgi:hypothetical protein